VRPQLRKLVLTAHVVSSVGWFGAVVVFMALAVAGLHSGDAQLVRAVYILMELVGWSVIVPLSLSSLLSGLVLSLGTTWGLFQHYWVVVKLLLTSIATIALVVHMRPISLLASAAAQGTLDSADLGGLRVQMAVDAGAALLVLVLLTAMSVYKPRGRTRYGWRKLYGQRSVLGP